tara:strand:+ start:121 stop:285 length:165 start_codon:yes stop_codon:yes gene_type:complete
MFFLAAELGMTVQELTSKLTKEEYINWIAYFELKREYEDKAIQDAKNKSQARKP